MIRSRMQWAFTTLLSWSVEKYCLSSADGTGGFTVLPGTSRAGIASSGGHVYEATDRERELHRYRCSGVNAYQIAFLVRLVKSLFPCVDIWLCTRIRLHVVIVCAHFVVLSSRLGVPFSLPTLLPARAHSTFQLTIAHNIASLLHQSCHHTSVCPSWTT